MLDKKNINLHLFSIQTGLFLLTSKFDSNFLTQIGYYTANMLSMSIWIYRTPIKKAALPNKIDKAALNRIFYLILLFQLGLDRCALGFIAGLVEQGKHVLLVSLHTGLVKRIHIKDVTTYTASLFKEIN